MTGVPKRLGNFGPIYDSEKLQMNKFSFDNFVFLSCEKCNNEFGKIEHKAKFIVHDLLNEKPLSTNDFNLFLTWFDKIRKGSYRKCYKTKKF